MPYLGLLFALAILLFVVWAAQRLIKAFGIGDPIATLIWVVVCGLALLFVIGQFGGVGHFGGRFC